MSFSFRVSEGNEKIRLSSTNQTQTMDELVHELTDFSSLHTRSGAAFVFSVPDDWLSCGVFLFYFLGVRIYGDFRWQGSV